jgi:hypothetical protein
MEREQVGVQLSMLLQEIGDLYIALKLAQKENLELKQKLAAPRPPEVLCQCGEGGSCHGG